MEGSSSDPGYILRCFTVDDTRIPNVFEDGACSGSPSQARLHLSERSLQGEVDAVHGRRRASPHPSSALRRIHHLPKAQGCGSPKMLRVPARYWCGSPLPQFVLRCSRRTVPAWSPSPRSLGLLRPLLVWSFKSPAALSHPSSVRIWSSGLVSFLVIFPMKPPSSLFLTAAIEMKLGTNIAPF